MATFLDITTLQSFSIIFIFLFVLLLVYALLYYTKIFGSNQVALWVFAVVVALLVIISDTATLVIKKIAPVIAVVFILIMLISIVAGGMLGHGHMPASFDGLKWIVLVILAVALIVGSLAVVRDTIDVPDRGEDYSKVSTVIFHPNFLGMILFLMVAVFTVALLATKSA